MTEDEAKTKWCPFVRVGSSSTGLGALNRDIQGYHERSDKALHSCIGSACMAWRWFGTHVRDPAEGPDLVWTTRTHGTCGLAGPWYAEDRQP